MNTIDKEKLINKVVEVQKIADKINEILSNKTKLMSLDGFLLSEEDDMKAEKLLDKLQFELVELKLSIGVSEEEDGGMIHDDKIYCE